MLALYVDVDMRSSEFSRSYWIGTRLNSLKSISALCVGLEDRKTLEILVNGQWVCIGAMGISSFGIRLPYLDRSSADRVAILIQDPSGDVDDIAFSSLPMP